MQDTSASLSFCDFSDSTTEGSIIVSKRDTYSAAPSDILPVSTIRSPLLQGNAPRLDVDWSDSPPLSISLRFSGIFSEADVDADTTRQTHQSRSVSLDMSYDIQTFPNLKDVVPDFGNDSDISEVLLMTQKLPATLSTIPEAAEPSPVLTYTTSLSDFDVLNLGTTSETGMSVMLCKRKKTGRIYTIRCRRDHFPWTEQDILEMIRDLGAPFLPHLRSSFREDGRIHLVLDHFPGGSLRGLVESTGPLTSQRVMFYASEILVGISNLHSIGVMHRNINPDDVTFDQSGHVVISNFEFAEAQCYQAPEILLGWAHDSVVDSWGFGMVLYFMYFGKHPFKIGAGPEGSEDLQARIIEGTLSPDSLRLIHPQTRDLILKCIERNPRIRLTVEEIKSHPFFASVSWAKVADRLVEIPPLPGSLERRDDVLAYSPSSPLSNPLGVIQLAPVQVQPLRIEKKSSKSPISTPRETAGSPFAGFAPPKSAGGGPRAYRPVLPADTDDELSKDKDVPPVSGAEIWDILDQEAAATSLGTAQSGKRFLSLFKPKKSRNNIVTNNSNSNHHHRVSSIYPRNKLFVNFSTASFSWKNLKSRHAADHGTTGSTPNVAFSYSRPESLDLPAGLEQIGSGIGFSYNLPPGIRSKASICSGTPRSCHNLFGARFAQSAATATAATTAVPSTTTVQASTSAKPLGPFHQLFQPPIGATSGPSQLASLFEGPIDNGEINTRNPTSSQSGLTRSTPWLASMQHPQTYSPRILGTRTGLTTMMTTSSSPESDDGPFTPTAVACEEPGVAVGEDCAREFDLSGGTLEGKMEPDLTLRLVSQPAFV